MSRRKNWKRRNNLRSREGRDNGRRTWEKGRKKQDKKLGIMCFGFFSLSGFWLSVLNENKTKLPPFSFLHFVLSLRIHFTYEKEKNHVEFYE